MHSFSTTEAVEEELIEVASEIERPLWMKLPRAPGKKEKRYQHLLSGEPDLESSETSVQTAQDPATNKLAARDERIQTLEDEVATLKAELAQLKESFGTFKQEFM
jgi:uncharacterized protein YceH (UPF0502 family)